jgi:hypothetical protein
MAEEVNSRKHPGAIATASEKSVIWRDKHLMNTKVLAVETYSAIYSALEKFSSDLDISTAQGLSRILEGLPGLTPIDLRTFEEPPHGAVGIENSPTRKSRDLAALQPPSKSNC